MISDTMMIEYAQDGDFPTVMRLWELCLGRANRYGHCAFEPGELAQTLGDPGGQKIRRALKQLRDKGRVAPESTTLCVVLDCRVVRRGDSYNPACRDPGHLRLHDRLWAGEEREWEPEPGKWQAGLDDPARAETIRQFEQQRASFN